MRNTRIAEKCGTNNLKGIRILEPRPPTTYKVQILLANKHNTRSSTRKDLLEPKSHLGLAITCGTLAL
jgi:hypothetical protein